MESIIIKNIKSDIHKTLEEYERMGLTFHARQIHNFKPLQSFGGSL